MNETIGNQQPSICSLKGWLGGIIDGEGCLQLAKQKYKDRFHFRPQLVISNNNLLIIEKIREVARLNNLPVYFMNRGYAAKDATAKTIALQIMGLRRVKLWLDCLTPYIFGKREQAEIISQYIDYRLSLPNSSRGIIRFGEKDMDFKERLNKANHRWQTRYGSTTTRRTNTFDV